MFNRALVGTSVLVIVLAFPTAMRGITGRSAAPALIVDHTALALFERIPAEFVERARNLRLLFRTASVGHNMSQGLDCLVDNARHSCRTGFTIAPPVRQQPQYARDNWLFEVRGNPGWYGKVKDFVAQVHERSTAFDVMTWSQDYSDDPGLVSFWKRTHRPSIEDIEAVEQAYPKLRVVYMTAALAKLRLNHIAEFNTAMRAYASDNGKPLFDLADIESHRPDGSPCVTAGVPTICPDYNRETRGGHLTNGVAVQRVAKAWWVFMARLAGWQP